MVELQITKKKTKQIYSYETSITSTTINLHSTKKIRKQK